MQWPSRSSTNLSQVTQVNYTGSCQYFNNIPVNIACWDCHLMYCDLELPQFTASFGERKKTVNWESRIIRVSYYIYLYFPSPAYTYIKSCDIILYSLVTAQITCISSWCIKLTHLVDLRSDKIPMYLTFNQSVKWSLMAAANRGLRYMVVLLYFNSFKFVCE